MKKQIVVIVGPTAGGKSKLALSLAKEIGGEIVSADSMQVYKKMDIGTAKLSKEEMQGIPHHMIDVVEPYESYSVNDFVNAAKAVIDDIISRNKIPILAGGTGLYIDTLLNGTRLLPAGSDEELRAKLNSLAADIGGAEMKKQLAEFDTESAERLHDNDIKRIVRAIEVYTLTGKTLTQWNKESAGESEYQPLYFGLTARDRGYLYSRIEQRVDQMFEAGLFEEVKGLIDSGIDEKCTAMQAIGYKETALAVKGKITKKEAAELIKLSTRRYAKRQLTWFKRNTEICWFFVDEEEIENISNKIQKMTKNAFSI